MFMAQLKAFAMRDGEKAVLHCDTESNGEDVRDGRGYGTGISLTFALFGDEFESKYLPVNHPDKENNLTDVQVEELKHFLETFTGWLEFHNAKFDLVNLSTMGINYTGKFYCTMIMCHLINENFPMSKSLNSCVGFYVGKEHSKKDDPGFKFLVKTYGWGGITSAVMSEYAEHDSRLLGMLHKAIIKKFHNEVPESYWQHKQDFHKVIMKMESRGILIDQHFCKVMIGRGEEEMERISNDLGGLRPTSPKDLHTLLIDKLGLPVVKTSPKTGKPSFDKEAMSIYDDILERRNDSTATEILAYRGWQKTVSSNYRAYLELVSPDGRLRPNYKLHGTKTGRMSCEKPNLQQIPRGSEKPWNGNLKQAFIPEDGWELWEFDYSQLELRLGTAYAQTEYELKKVFEEDRDIFTEMSGPLGLTRQDTKTFVYSTQYGAGLNRLMHVFGISMDQAARMRENYFAAYPGFAKISKIASNRCRTAGKVQLWSGRYRHFYDRRNEAHKAFNSVIQGGAADIVEHVMVRLFNEIDSDNECRMLLQVHDSVIFEIRSDVVDVYREQIERIMADVRPDFGVKFKVEGKKMGKAA